MRIIDADALDWAFTSLRWRDGELLHWGDRPNWCLVGEEVEKLIADAPTIDAIPVEWLEDRVYDMKRAPLYRRYAEMLLMEWLQEQKEQEAQDG